MARQCLLCYYELTGRVFVASKNTHAFDIHGSTATDTVLAWESIVSCYFLCALQLALFSH